MLSESTTSPVKFTNVIVNGWIDLGIQDLAAKHVLDTSQSTIALVGSDTFASSEPNYGPGSNVMNIRQVFMEDNSGYEKEIPVVDESELSVIFGPSWRATTEVGIPSIAARADYNVLRLHVRPNASMNGRTLRFIFDRIPSALASDTDTPIFINALHDALVWWGVSRGWDVYGKPDMSEKYLKRYERKAAEFKNIGSRFATDMNRFRWG